jgi:predicted Zn finger-like uncharacterized protein
MFTVCPKCTLTLALTTADLRMGQGYVRCGRCANVFNALLTLSEEPADAGSAPPALQYAEPPAQTPAEPPVEDAALSEAQAAPAPAPAPPATTEPSNEGAIENESNYAEGTGTFETIVLEGDAITQTEEYVPEASVDSEIAALTERLSLAAQEPPFAAATDAAANAIAAPTARLSSPWPWALGSVLLILLLALQGIHHWREQLATIPAWNRPLNHLYAALGLPLNPNWNLAAYDVRQQGASSDPADSQIIRVRLSVANHATRAQPPPLLRLTLLDRYGKPLAMSELAPGDYWPAGQPLRAFLGHDERVDSEVAVRDPSAASTSFELDVCLRDGAGALHCAGDSALAAAAGVRQP